MTVKSGVDRSAYLFQALGLSLKQRDLPLKRSSINHITICSIKKQVKKDFLNREIKKLIQEGYTEELSSCYEKNLSQSLQ